ncbi:MAG: hypothetical protein KGL25_03165 [Gammaproteobacteria bacterium]|nr:hypothetical protein [Gammaproteobacteria bacterium]
MISIGASITAGNRGNPFARYGIIGQIQPSLVLDFAGNRLGADPDGQFGSYFAPDGLKPSLILDFANVTYGVRQ